MSEMAGGEKGLKRKVWKGKKENVWFKYDLEQKYYAPQVRPEQGLNSQPPDHEGSLHVTKTPALTTRPSGK